MVSEGAGQNIQEHLDEFELRIIRQLGSGKAPNIADIQDEVAEIMKIVAELSERLVAAQLVIETVIPSVEGPNNFVVSVDEQDKKN